MQLRILPAGLLALVLVLGACGDDDGDDTSTATETTAARESTTASTEASDGTEASESTAPVAVADTELGEVLVDDTGLTLYAFANDTGGTPTCTGDCAANWPPVLVDEVPEGVEGIDDGVLGVVDDGAGGQQLTADGQPLYLYAGDAAPGDVNGQGVGGVWFAVAPDGTMIDSATDTAGGDSGY